LLHVLREDQNGQVRHLLACLDGRAQPFVPVTRREPNIDDGDVRAVLEYRGKDVRAAVCHGGDFVA